MFVDRLYSEKPSSSAGSSAGVNPIDQLEAMFVRFDWPYDRVAENRLAVGTQGKWCLYHLLFEWQPDLEGFQVVSRFDFTMREGLADKLDRLLNLINGKTWLGHFERCTDDATLLYRIGIPTRGSDGIPQAILRDVIDTVLSSCECYYPAFQYVIWARRSPEAALAQALLDNSRNEEAASPGDGPGNNPGEDPGEDFDRDRDDVPDEPTGGPEKSP